MRTAACTAFCCALAIVPAGCGGGGGETEKTPIAVVPSYQAAIPAGTTYVVEYNAKSAFLKSGGFYAATYDETVPDAKAEAACGSLLSGGSPVVLSVYDAAASVPIVATLTLSAGRYKGVVSSQTASLATFTVTSPAKNAYELVQVDSEGTTYEEVARGSDTQAATLSLGQPFTRLFETQPEIAGTEDAADNAALGAACAKALDNLLT